MSTKYINGREENKVLTAENEKQAKLIEELKINMAKKDKKIRDLENHMEDTETKLRIVEGSVEDYKSNYEKTVEELVILKSEQATISPEIKSTFRNIQRAHIGTESKEVDCQTDDLNKSMEDGLSRKSGSTRKYSEVGEAKAAFMSPQLYTKSPWTLTHLPGKKGIKVFPGLDVPFAFNSRNGSCEGLYRKDNSDERPHCSSFHNKLSQPSPLKSFLMDNQHLLKKFKSFLANRSLKKKPTLERQTTTPFKIEDKNGNKDYFRNSPIVPGHFSSPLKPDNPQSATKDLREKVSTSHDNQREYLRFSAHSGKVKVNIEPFQSGLAMSSGNINSKYEEVTDKSLARFKFKNPLRGNPYIRPPTTAQSIRRSLREEKHEVKTASDFVRSAVADKITKSFDNGSPAKSALVNPVHKKDSLAQQYMHFKDKLKKFSK